MLILNKNDELCKIIHCPSVGEILYCTGRKRRKKIGCKLIAILYHFCVKITTFFLCLLVNFVHQLKVNLQISSLTPPRNL
jgi:hypothetical protein